MKNPVLKPGEEVMTELREWKASEKLTPSGHHLRVPSARTAGFHVRLERRPILKLRILVVIF